MELIEATAKDGTRIVAEAHGPADDALPVVCLPGLTRNARDFTALAEALAAPGGGAARRVIIVESRGRGRSGRAAADTYTVPQEMDDLLTAFGEWDIETAQFVGTSRGGLLTMFLALHAPERIDRAVLNDIGPTLERAGLARIGAGVGARMDHASHEALADYLSQSQGSQFPRMARENWVRFAKQLASPNADGGVTFDYDPGLAEGLRGYDVTQATPDFWPGFEALADKPVLVIRGAHSDLLSAATVEAMRRRHPRLEALIVPDEGHAPLLWDRPSIEAIKSFLA